MKRNQNVNKEEVASERKADRRVTRTKKLIRCAFIKLLTQKEYGEITIRDVADLADVDRKTVYNYYPGTYAIMSELENEMVALLDESVAKLDFQNNFGNPKRIFEALTEIINSNIEVYGPLFDVDTKSYIIDKIEKRLTQKVKDGLARSPIPFPSLAELETTAVFVTSGMLAAYRQWYINGCVQPLEKLSEELGTLILHGLTALQGSDDNKNTKEKKQK